MNLMRRLLNKIKHIFLVGSMLLKILFLSVFNKKKIYIFGTAIHGNLGDQAILLGEEMFLQDNFKDYKVIEIESRMVTRFTKLLKKLIGNSLILMQGGGFLGTLWIHEEEMFKNTLKCFPNNPIIVFPQTIYFSDDENGKNVLKESKKAYYGHKNLFICCRERYSYDFMKENFPKCNILLIPDMVLYLEHINDKTEGENILFCIRNDKEKLDHDYDYLLEYFDKKGFKVDYTDTVINQNVFSFNRKELLDKKIIQFSKYKLIVTDRLHGMVLSLIANTPCLVFETKSYKIRGVYAWIKELKQVKLINSKIKNKDIDNFIKDANEEMANFNIRELYIPLVDLIKNKL